MARCVRPTAENGIAALAFGLPPHKRLYADSHTGRMACALMPAFGNEMIFLMHGSSVASIIGLSRIWLLTARGKIGGDPVVYVFRDRPSLICGALLLSILWLSA